MPVTGFDHLYLETAAWERSLEFWERVGFREAKRWGSEGHRAARLVAGTAVVVLAEIDAGALESTVFFAADDLAGITLDAGDVVAPLHETHWGTRLIRLRDPEGRAHALESPG